MAKKQKMTEQDLARAIVTVLKDWNWDVYQEVEGPCGRCDIVAVQGNIQWAIECKLTFGFPVIEQAYNWIIHNRAHYVSIAIPYRSAPGSHSLANNLLKRSGIGILELYHHWENNADVRETLKPQLHRMAKGFRLHEEQKTICDAGGNNGGHWTDFKKTKKNLINAVLKKPGIEFAVLIKELDHHYSSLSTAKSCLRKFVGGSVIPELKVEMIGSKLCVFPADKETANAH